MAESHNEDQEKSITLIIASIAARDKLADKNLFKMGKRLGNTALYDELNVRLKRK